MGVDQALEGAGSVVLVRAVSYPPSCSRGEDTANISDFCHPLEAFIKRLMIPLQKGT